MSLTNASLADLVRPDSVHKRVYTDPAIFALEMERIYGRAWIYVGHESQVKAPGDYHTTRIGDQVQFTYTWDQDDSEPLEDPQERTGQP